MLIHLGLNAPAQFNASCVVAAVQIHLLYVLPTERVHQ